jgi:hypothetical protein
MGPAAARRLRAPIAAKPDVAGFEARVGDLSLALHDYK